MRRLALFDIDHTLISLNCGNLPQPRALNAAFEQVHGIRDAFDDVSFTGGMDLPLMLEVYRKWGPLEGGLEVLLDISDFKTAYFESLKRNLNSWADGEIYLGGSRIA